MTFLEGESGLAGVAWLSTDVVQGILGLAVFRYGRTISKASSGTKTGCLQGFLAVLNQQ